MLARSASLETLNSRVESFFLASLLPPLAELESESRSHGSLCGLGRPPPAVSAMGVLDRAQTKVRAPVMPAHRPRPSTSVVAATAGSQFELFLGFFHRRQLGGAGACRSWSLTRIGPDLPTSTAFKMAAAGDLHAISALQDAFFSLRCLPRARPS